MGAMTEHLLREVGRIPTSGARAVEPVQVGDVALLAVPQLAYDVPGTAADMNGGDSNTEMLLLARDGDGFRPWGSLPAPGGEDAEFFTIEGQSFLAVAGIRSGSGPYRFDIDSHVWAWDGHAFTRFQSIPGYAAKQWRHVGVDGRHFLALAQGIALPGHEGANLPSRLYEWDGTRFVHFQDIDSRWGYNWHHLEIDGTHLFAHADHVGPSVLYRWDGIRFVSHQTLAPRACRAFASFVDAGDTYLVVGCLQTVSTVMRWDGDRFVHHQELAGLGAREFAVVHGARGLYVVRVNFISGTPADPQAALTSQLYRWHDGALQVVDEFPTTGGTDVAVLPDEAGALVVISNSLSADVRFAADTVIYRFTDS